MKLSKAAARASWLLCLCLGCAAPSVSSEATGALERMRARIVEPEDLRFVSHQAPLHSVRAQPTRVWIFDRMKEEQVLLTLKAGSEVLQAFQTERESWEFRARLAVLLAELGHAPAVDALRSIQEPTLLRELCRVVANVLESRQDLKAIERFLEAEELEQVIDTTKGPWVAERQKHLGLRARKTPETEFLDLDLWGASYVRNPLTVRLLVKATAYHRTEVQGMALNLLERDVLGGPEFQSTRGFDLQTLEVHHQWELWWRAHGQALHWDVSSGKYVGKRPG